MKASLALLFLILTSCSSPARLAPATVNQDAAATSAIRTNYDTGFRRAVEGLPDKEAFLKLYQDSLWVVLKADGTLYALEAGRRPRVALALYDERHPSLLIPGPTLHVSTMDQGRPVVLIRPDKMSEGFAGLGLIHEMSHVLDILNRSETDADSDETKAYRHQKWAANHLSERRFDAALDRLLENYRIKDTADLIRLIRKRDEKFHNELETQLNQALGLSEALSLSEREMRLGFYIVSMELRRQADRGDTIKSKRVGDILRAASKY